MDYTTSTDESDRGNGKIYVDQSDIGHCPINGEALKVSTFLVVDPGDYRFGLSVNSAVVKV